jgi:putative ABC transport system permease protein
MRIPLSYTLRNLLARKLTVALTIGGVALVVFVFSAVLMLAHGLEETMVNTGNERNVIALRSGANAELESGITREVVNIVRTLPQVASNDQGQPLLSADVVTIINLHKLSTHDMGNVIVRGIEPGTFALRPVVKLSAGRMFETGSREIIVGSSIHRQFEGAGLDQHVKIAGDQWKIVGVFNASKTGFESEIWGDVEQLMQALNRTGIYSSITMRLRAEDSLASLQREIDADQRLQQLKMEVETDYYARQSELMASFIRILGIVITIIFSAGAMIGAMITMYSAVANRTVEIGTLRALGFQRRSILFSFLFESITLAILGGLCGLVLASFLEFFTISTINFGTFAELAFSFSLNPMTALVSMVFAVVMGLVGGFLPAVRAARLQIITALRSS